MPLVSRPVSDEVRFLWRKALSEVLGAVCIEVQGGCGKSSWCLTRQESTSKYVIPTHVHGVTY